MAGRSGRSYPFSSLAPPHPPRWFLLPQVICLDKYLLPQVFFGILPQVICFYCRKWWVTPRGHTHNLSHTHTQQAWHLQHCNIVAAFVRKAWRYEDAIWMVSVWYLAWKELKPFFDFLIFFGCVGLWEWNSDCGRNRAWEQLKYCFKTVGVVEPQHGNSWKHVMSGPTWQREMF